MPRRLQQLPTQLTNHNLVDVSLLSAGFTLLSNNTIPCMIECYDGCLYSDSSAIAAGKQVIEFLHSHKGYRERNYVVRDTIGYNIDVRVDTQSLYLG